MTSFKHKLDKYQQNIPDKQKIPGYTIKMDTNSITSMRSSWESWAIQLRQSHRLGRRDYTLTNEWTWNKWCLTSTSYICGVHFAGDNYHNTTKCDMILDQRRNWFCEKKRCPYCMLLKQVLQYLLQWGIHWYDKRKTVRLCYHNCQSNSPDGSSAYSFAGGLFHWDHICNSV